jgi:hypothetical protein
MARVKVSPWRGAGAVLVAALCAAPAVLAIPVDPPDIFRVASLRAILNSAPAWSRLEALAERLPLWTLELRAEPALSGESCIPVAAPGGGATLAGQLRQTLAFGSRDGRSSRAYLAEFTACQKSAGEDEVHEITAERWGFASAPERGEAPVIPDATALRILKLALNDAEVAGRLEEIEKTSAIRHLRIRRVGEDPCSPVYLLVAAEAPPEEWDASTRRVAFTAVYDAAEGTAVFSEEEDVPAEP